VTGSMAFESGEKAAAILVAFIATFATHSTQVFIAVFALGMIAARTVFAVIRRR
jgi:hypothetical protein